MVEHIAVRRPDLARVEPRPYVSPDRLVVRHGQGRDPHSRRINRERARSKPGFALPSNSGNAVFVEETSMPNPSDSLLRAVLGPTLQTAALRAVLLLAAFALLGAGCTYVFR